MATNIEWTNAPTKEDVCEDLISRLSRQRKLVETEGVVVSGARFAGNPENRQAITEALKMAEASSMDSFSVWKDSDNKFVKNLSVTDVETALRQIGERRQQLIAKESEHVDQINAGTLTDINELDWSI